MRVVVPARLRAAEIESWRELRAKAEAPANPFMEPEFTLAVARVRPATRVAVVEERGEPVGFLPFERTRLGRARAVGQGVSDCQGAVLKPGLALSADEVLRALGVSVWEFDNLEDGQDLFVPYAAERVPSPVIDVSDGYAAYEAGLRERSPKYLRTTLAKERRLGRAHGEVRFVFDERDPAALRTLMDWKSAQYRRTGRRDRFAQPWIAELVRRLHGADGEGCTGVLSVLSAGGRPVAAHFGLRSHSVLSCWFPAYDPEFARFSPGMILHLRMAEGAAAAGLGLLDLGRGAAEYKDALKTGELSVYEGAAVRAGAGAVVHWLSREPARRAHRFVRDRPLLAALAQDTLKRAARLRRARRPS
ncbi:GNAT family N-acetyltransferase [Streptomyces sp. NPDC060194]|uniref:GNAT family N-acetyltransferase n=1 Tax=Streptomyces sp. NPDC060194 TaxID=3347069 RepID=UPI003650F1D6